MRKYFVFILFTQFVLYILFSCESSNAKQLRDFYLGSNREQDKGTLFIYRPVGAEPTAPADYWYQKRLETDSGTYLQVRFYDKDKVLRQESLEKIAQSGVLQKQLSIIEKSAETGQLEITKAELISNAIFPFEVVDTNTMVVYEMKYALPGRAGQKVAIRRNRRFAGAANDFTFEGKKYPTIKMILAETVTSEGEGNATIQGEGEEWYAKGLGLVYYRKSYGSGEISEEYELVQILPCPDANCL